MKFTTTSALVLLAQVCTPRPVDPPTDHRVEGAVVDPQAASAPASGQQPRPQAPDSWPGALPPRNEGRRDQPAPQPTLATSIEAEHVEIQAEIARLSEELNATNRDVVARYGRNDTPAALAVLTPIRDQLANARLREQHLLCRDAPPVPDPQKLFASMGIRMDHFKVDSRFVDAYITAKVRDGALSQAEADRLRFIISKSGHGVMNPSSLGASTINQRIAQALQCFGLKGPPRSGKVRLPKPPPVPAPPPPSKLRYFRTCGDNVCVDHGYRGPFPGIPRCIGQKEGDPCAVKGEECDLVNDCNMFLMCSDTNPSTQCPR